LAEQFDGMSLISSEVKDQAKRVAKRNEYITEILRGGIRGVSPKVFIPSEHHYLLEKDDESQQALEDMLNDIYRCYELFDELKERRRNINVDIFANKARSTIKSIQNYLFKLNSISSRSAGAPVTLFDLQEDLPDDFPDIYVHSCEFNGENFEFTHFGRLAIKALVALTKANPDGALVGRSPKTLARFIVSTFPKEFAYFESSDINMFRLIAIIERDLFSLSTDFNRIMRVKTEDKKNAKTPVVRCVHAKQKSLSCYVAADCVQAFLNQLEPLGISIDNLELQLELRALKDLNIVLKNKDNERDK
jgi:hypothetical protein